MEMQIKTTKQELAFMIREIWERGNSNFPISKGGKTNSKREKEPHLGVSIERRIRKEVNSLRANHKGEWVANNENTKHESKHIG